MSKSWSRISSLEKGEFDMWIFGHFHLSEDTWCYGYCSVGARVSMQLSNPSLNVHFFFFSPNLYWIVTFNQKIFPHLCIQFIKT